MNERYPRIRFQDKFSGAWLREGLRFDFYMRRLHTQMAPAVLQSMEAYVRAIGPEALSLYVDEEGDWQELDESGWSLIRRKLLEYTWPNVILGGSSPGNPNRNRFEYHGSRRVDVPGWRGADKEACVASFWLSTEYLEAHGPEHVRALALELAAPLPWCSGNGGLAILAPIHLMGMTREVYERCMRYPGMDIPDVEIFSCTIGTRIRGPSWLTFLGQPVLSALGGVEALRARLHTPGTTVQALEGERAVVTLGEWPEAGDRERGLTLPAYRELARVLEPWLYLEHRLHPDFPPEALRQWERRFLE